MSDTITREELEQMLESAMLDNPRGRQVAAYRLALKSFDQPAPPDDVVEVVARAIAQANEQNGAAPYEYHITLGKHAKEFLFDEARAAIRALSEANLLKEQG